MIVRRRCSLPASTLLLLCCATAAFPQSATYWTGGAPDDLWTSPTNWTSGVPDADTSAVFSGEDGTRWTVDLDGGTVRAKLLDVGWGSGAW